MIRFTQASKQPRALALSFQNPSRSYDDARKRVRFIGHDGMFEIPFAVENDALASKNQDEATYLAAFDKMLGAIHKAALKAYEPGKKTDYVLTRADFK